MTKGSGGTGKIGSTQNYRTGPGFTEPIKDPKESSSKVMVVHNIGTLASNKVKDGKEAHV